MMAHAQKPDFVFRAKRTSPFKSAEGRQFSRLLAAEVCASAVVMLDAPCSEVECKTTGHPLHSHVSPSLPQPCVTVCHQVSTELYPEHATTVMPCDFLSNIASLSLILFVSSRFSSSLEQGRRFNSVNV